MKRFLSQGQQWCWLVCPCGRLLPCVIGPESLGDAEHGCIEHHQRACTLTIAASSKTPTLVERSATSLVLFPFTSYSENCVEKVQRREEISSK